MNKLISCILVTVVTCFTITGCLKDNSNNTPAVDCSTITTTAPNDEISILKQKLDSIGVFSRVQDPRGFFYTMDSAAAVDPIPHPIPCSNIAVTYSVAVIGGAVFEKKDTAIAFPLYTAITGWKQAVPLMRENATMTLYLPPTLAYGTGGFQTIPGNAYMKFIIKLYDFSN